ncbi:MAG TPA: cysteine--tRNA ligase [Gemmataceae bacterium]|nr:cysteine--tRNA ligase [Gemmataceae bacterium]
MALHVYNTLTRRKEEFTPPPPAPIGMYVCGPTVYKPSHIGHMVGPVIFDTVKRYLTYLGYRVTWVVNITDVDDKLIVRARELGTTVAALAEQMTRDYVECLRRLNVTGIDQMPRATEHIPEMIEIIRGLIDKGYAYAAGGDVYFDVTRDPDYGKLCRRDPEQMAAGARIEVSEKKRNPGDFALWKGAKPGEPAWDSPWGPGRPGWHIECSAMSMKYLGPTLDIHGGGDDLKFPHHENELAQSESYTGRPFVRYWMHNGLLKMGTAKMAGSVGNVINIADLLQRHAAETVRFLLLSTHYRSPIEYSEKRLDEMQRALEGFYRFFERYQRITGQSFYDLEAPKSRAPFDTGGASELPAEVARRRDAFLEHMDDDFNTGGAIGVLYELLTTLNRFADSRQLEAGRADPAVLADFRRGVVVLRELSQILGLFREPPAAGAGGDQLVGGLMQLLIDLRADARKAKNFALADQIRQRLAELGITLEDRPGGTTWRLGQ